MRVGPSDELVAGDLYAKVTAGGSSVTLRFTAVPPAELRRERLGPQTPERSAELAQHG